MISDGFNIYPAELENVIAAHPDVVEAEASVTEKELVEFCSVHLGDDKRPGTVVLRRDRLPKTPVGKDQALERFPIGWNRTRFHPIGNARTGDAGLTGHIQELREPFRVGRERRVAGN